MNQNLLKFLIPVVAVIVILESVVLISGMKKNTVVQVNDLIGAPTVVETGNVTEAVPTAIEGQPVLNVALETKTVDMEVGKSYTVELKANGIVEKNYDSLALFVKYNSSALDIAKLEPGEKMTKPQMAKVSPQKGLVVVNYMIGEPKGMRLGPGETVTLATFEVTPKQAGNFDIELSTGKDGKESVTMFVENVTTKALPFSSNKLRVNVVNK